MINSLLYILKRLPSMACAFLCPTSTHCASRGPKRQPRPSGRKALRASSYATMGPPTPYEAFSAATGFGNAKKTRATQRRRRQAMTAATRIVAIQSNIAGRYIMMAVMVAEACDIKGKGRPSSRPKLPAKVYLRQDGREPALSAAEGCPSPRDHARYPGSSHPAHCLR